MWVTDRGQVPEGGLPGRRLFLCLPSYSSLAGRQERGPGDGRGDLQASLYLPSLSPLLAGGSPVVSIPGPRQPMMLPR